MPDPHKNLLTFFYESRINEAKAYLKARYPLTVCDVNDHEVREIPKSLPKEFVPYEFWRLELQEFTFIVAIPNTFPDTFPKIYLPERDYERIYPVPHVDKNRFVCTRDPEVVVINDAKPGEALEELLGVAVQIVEAGIKKENLGDYVEEFIAYWAEKTDTAFLSLFTPKDQIMPLNVYTLSEKLFDAWYVISDSESLVERWLAPFRIRIDRGKEKVALYLPFEELSPEFFEKKKGVLEILKDLKNLVHARAVQEYFNQVKGPVTLIMSFAVQSERVLFGWTFPGWKSIRGFRKNRVPLEVRLTQTDHKLITEINIKRMDKERILKRGGANNLLVGKDTSIILAGCGSLGSYLAMSLARCGISKYLLIDKETLEPENVARHLCGFVDASKKMKKVEAVKKRLQEHFPNIECEVYDGDVLHLLNEEGRGRIEAYDLTIVAIGNTTVERRINYLVRKKDIKKPIIYLWMEPLAVGGHVLFIHPEKGGCFNCCFDGEGQFLYQVAAKEQTFSRREAGCQTTYLPYSSVEVEHFISVACKRILKIIEGKEEKSRLFTWLGDLEGFKSLGFRVSDRYVTDFSYCTIEKEILTTEECVICGNRQGVI
jgi:molybdopterin/thiamine biosynthesis adenylyltransferase